MPAKHGIRYMKLAKEISTWSKDPRKQIGAVVVGHKGQVLSQGYNGFPRGIEDSLERYNDRDEKRKYVIHAEMNCIYNASFNGVSLEGNSIYVYGLPPCSECAKAIIQAGIKEVYYSADITEDFAHWEESFKVSKGMFDEVGIEYHKLTGV
jgi:dCMP deaminase